MYRDTDTVYDTQYLYRDTLLHRQKVTASLCQIVKQFMFGNCKSQLVPVCSYCTLTTCPKTSNPKFLCSLVTLCAGPLSTKKKANKIYKKTSVPLYTLKESMDYEFPRAEMLHTECNPHSTMTPLWTVSPPSTMDSRYTYYQLGAVNRMSFAYAGDIVYIRNAQRLT